jgi:hypothetical protein
MSDKITLLDIFKANGIPDGLSVETKNMIAELIDESEEKDEGDLPEVERWTPRKCM